MCENDTYLQLLYETDGEFRHTSHLAFADKTRSIPVAEQLTQLFDPDGGQMGVAGGDSRTWNSHTDSSGPGNQTQISQTVVTAQFSDDVIHY